MMLSISALCSAYGRVNALHDVSVDVARGQIVALVGSNGAGKTTLLRCISGIQPVRSGGISWKGQDIGALPAAKRVALGISQVPEGRLIFGSMSVQDNLLLGGFTRGKADLAPSLDEVFELFPILRERRVAIAGTLSGGEQQMLAIGRALMAQPSLLLLDEPSLGLAPLVVGFIMERVQELNRRGMTVMLVEQNASLALKLAHHAYVLETGRVTTRGSGEQLLGDPDVQAAYLGI